MPLDSHFDGYNPRYPSKLGVGGTPTLVFLTCGGLSGVRLILRVVD